MWGFIVGSQGFWSCLLWAQQAVRWILKVVAAPHFGDVMAESVSFNLKSSLPGFTGGKVYLGNSPFLMFFLIFLIFLMFVSHETEVFPWPG